MNFVSAFVFLVKFWIMVTRIALLTLKISYWSFILCEYELLSSIKPLLTTTVLVFQNVENLMKFSKIFEKSQKIRLHQHMNFWMSSNEDLIREVSKMLVLLYEFPAETRLTVYRRLDIPKHSQFAGPGTSEHPWILSSRLYFWQSFILWVTGLLY